MASREISAEEDSRITNHWRWTNSHRWRRRKCRRPSSSSALNKKKKKKKVRRNFTVSDDRFFCMCLASFIVREEEHHVTQRHHLNNTVRANNELSKTGKGQRVVFWHIDEREKHLPSALSNPVIMKTMITSSFFFFSYKQQHRCGWIIKWVNVLLDSYFEGKNWQ